MNMKRGYGLVGAGAVMAVIGSGCGSDEVETRKTLQNVKFDVGGAVVYANDLEFPLEGASVTLRSTEGETFEATANADGLWQIMGVPPGIYSERYELEGYQSLKQQLALEAQGENDIGNLFVSRGTVALPENGLEASLNDPLAVELEDGDELAHGVGGANLVYSKSSDGFIRVAFNQTVYNTSNTIISLQDHSSLETVYAQPNQDRREWTFSKASLDAMNGDSGLTVDGDEYTLHTITISSAESYTQIHGDLVTLTATVRFDAVN